MAERKGHHTLLQAAAFLQQKGIQLRYLICGDGLLRTTLESETQTLGLAENVSFLGFVRTSLTISQSPMWFVHVPLWEGLGVAVIEALAAGLPVVASRVGGIPELIENERSGLLVPPQEPTILAAAVERVVHDLPWAKTLGIHGQSFVRSRYDVTVMAQANEALYYKLLVRYVGRDMPHLYTYATHRHESHTYPSPFSIPSRKTIHVSPPICPGSCPCHRRFDA